MKNSLLFILHLLLISCGNKKPAAEKETGNTQDIVQLTDAQLKNAGLVTGKISHSEISAKLTLTGSIEVPPQNTISVSAPLGGYLKYTRLIPGMRVHKGELIATLEDMQFIELQQDYLLAKSRLALTETEYHRQQELNSTKSSSDKVFQQAKNEYESQRIYVRSLSEKLSLAGINPSAINETNISRTVNIYAPSDGFVSKVNVNTGKHVASSEVMFEILNLQDVHLNLKVFEKDINRLRIGQELTAFTIDNADQKYLAEIVMISHNLNDQRMGEVHCHFKKYDASLLPGMFMNAEINITSHNALSLPSEAIIRWNNQNYIFLKKDKNTFEMVKVQAGINEDGMQEITSLPSDIETKGEIVIKNAYALLMQLKNKNEN